jgi:hypothetical protein
MVASIKQQLQRPTLYFAVKQRLSSPPGGTPWLSM